MASNIITLNSYTRGASNVRGHFLLSTNDPNDCYTGGVITTENPDEFISETINGNGGSGSCVDTGYYFSPFTDGNGNYYSKKTIVNNGNTTYSDQVPSTAKFSLKYFKEYNNITLQYGGLGYTTPYGSNGYFYTDNILYNVEKYQYYTTGNVLTNKDWSGYLDINHTLLGGFYGVNDYYIDTWSMNLGTWSGANDPSRVLVNGNPYWNILETQSANRGGIVSNTSGTIQYGAGDLTYSVVANLLPYGTGVGGQYLVNYLPAFAPQMNMGAITYRATGIMELLCPV